MQNQVVTALGLEIHPEYVVFNGSTTNQILSAEGFQRGALLKLKNPVHACRWMYIERPRPGYPKYNIMHVAFYPSRRAARKGFEPYPHECFKETACECDDLGSDSKSLYIQRHDADTLRRESISIPETITGIWKPMTENYQRSFGDMEIRSNQFHTTHRGPAVVLRTETWQDGLLLLLHRPLDSEWCVFIRPYDVGLHGKTNVIEVSYHDSLDAAISVYPASPEHAIHWGYYHKDNINTQ